MNQRSNLLNTLNNPSTGGRRKHHRKRGGQSSVVVSSPHVAYNDISSGNQSTTNQYSTIATHTNQSAANAQYDNLGEPAQPVPSNYYAMGGKRRKRKEKKKKTKQI